MSTRRYWLGLGLLALLAAPGLHAWDVEDPIWTRFLGFTFEHRRGALIVEKLEPLSFAQVIGVKDGDAILELNGFPVSTRDDFERVARYHVNHRPSRWSLDVAREGVKQTFTLTPRPGTFCESLSLTGCGPFPR